MQENTAATESALTDRLRFVKLDAKSAEQVRELKPIIERELPIGLDKFYDQVRVTEEARKFFRGEDHIANAKNAQINHWQAISSCTFDSGYWPTRPRSARRIPGSDSSRGGTSAVIP